jgi:hypothetical protein
MTLVGVLVMQRAVQRAMYMKPQGLHENIHAEMPTIQVL